MEKFNYNFEKTKNYSNLFWIISILSWLCFIGASIYSFFDNRYATSQILFTIIIYPLFKWTSKGIIYTGGTIYPLQMHLNYFNLLIFIISLLSFLSLFIYSFLVFCILKRKYIKINDISLLNNNKYIFIPLFSATILFLIGEWYHYNASRWKIRNILGLFFNIISFLTIIIIYYNFNLTINSNIKLLYLIKKLGYSCIIGIEWYYLCYIITNIFIIYSKENYFFYIIKILGFLLPIKFGIGAIFFSFYFKDLIIAFLSFLINIGCAHYFFSIDKIYRNKYNGNLDGIIYILISIILFLEIVFLCVKYNKELFK